MMPFCRYPRLRSFALPALLCGFLIGSASAVGDEILSVRLVDGRRLQGTLHTRTDPHFLWLETARPTISLTSRFSWSQVLGVKAGERYFDRDAFQSRLGLEQPNHGQTARALPRREREIGTRSHSDDAVETDAIPHLKERQIPFEMPRAFQGWHAPHFDPRAVRSLHIDAQVANWDSDAEADGLRVSVAPIDRYGRIIPVDASIDLRLVGERVSGQGGQHVRRRRRLKRLGEWSHRIRSTDFGPDGAFLEIPFRTVANQFEIAPEALLTARLGVSGVGAFDADQTVFLPARPPAYRN